MFLGIDVGSESLKVVALGETGHDVAAEQEPYTFDTPQPGWTECHPDVWWSACLEALTRLGRRIDLWQVNSIGVTGQMHSAVLLDKSNAPLAKALLWNDQRSADAVLELETRVSRADIQRVTGNRLAAGFTAAKLGWWRKHYPELLAQVAKVVMPKDYVVFRLTGQLGTDVSDASGTGVFDVASRSFARDLIRELGFFPDWFPHARESIEVVGGILHSAASQTGLRQGTPVLAGAADNAASAVGVGASLPSTAMVSIGTSGVVLVPTRDVRVPTDEELRSREPLHLFCHALPNTWYRMGVTLSAGYSLQWFRRMLSSAVQTGTNKGIEKGTETNPEISFEAVNAWAQHVESAAEGLYFLPYLTGERTPLMNANARGVFFGLAANHDARHMVRAVMEGVGFSLKDSLALIEKTGAMPGTVQLTGGVVNSLVWSQLICDILGLPIGMQSRAGAAYGAAQLCRVAAGLHPTAQTGSDKEGIQRALQSQGASGSHLSAGDGMGTVLQPRMPATDNFQLYYQRYQAIVRTLQGLW